MSAFFLRYALLVGIVYLLLYLAQEQQSTFFLVNHVNTVKYFALILLVLAGISYILSLFFGEVQNLSGKKCVRCNKPALKGFVYCHEHLKQTTVTQRK